MVGARDLVRRARFIAAVAAMLLVLFVASGALAQTDSRPGQQDADYENPRPTVMDESRVTMRLQQESEVDAVGDARTRLRLKMEPQVFAFLRRMLSRQVLGGRSIDIPLRSRNFLAFLDFDAIESLIEDAEAEFTEGGMTVRMRNRGFARHADGRWFYEFSTDPEAAYELVKKERGRVVTIRGSKEVGDGGLLALDAVIVLPEGAHDITVEGKPSRLMYRLPAAAQKGISHATFQLEKRPHLLTALYKLYGDRRFPKQWAARSVFRNVGEEALRDYRVRYRLTGYSVWSPWQYSDVVQPGQTVVDLFRPVIDPKVREVRKPTAVTMETEYEYTRADGRLVHDTRMVTCKLLGFNDGVYTDVPLDFESPWCLVLKGMPLLLASFTTGNDPVMGEVVQRCRQAVGGASPKAGDKEAMRFLEAVHDLMRVNIAYEEAEGSIIDGVLRQYLKYGRDVLRTKKGTCMNTAILYASVAEAAGLETQIVVVPGHAFILVRLPKSRRPIFIETTLGTRTANAPFSAACKIGEQEFQEAYKAGLFLLVNIAELRARGVTPPDLPDVDRHALERWNIKSPDAAAKPAKTDAAAPPNRERPMASILKVRKEPDVVRDGLRGMAFHVRLRIQHCRGASCELFVVCLDRDKRPVRTDLDGYSADGLLMNLVRITPEKEDQEYDDVVLFLLIAGTNSVRGTNEFTAVISVGSDGKSLIDEPTLVPWKIIKHR
jgi:hypothetical protein